MIKQNKLNLLHSLHSIEDALIELESVVRLLDGACGDDGGQMCLTMILEERLKGLQQRFYAHWEMVVEEGTKFSGHGNPEARPEPEAVSEALTSI